MQRASRKLQSAMEYLMTYGWAILAIAIVMVSLYSLGIFNGSNLQPTATPGSCEVVRTAAQISLAGQCNNLIPKYVGMFNGASSYINTAFVNKEGSWTISAWINARQFQTTNLNSNHHNIIDSDLSGSYGNGFGIEGSPTVLRVIYNNGFLNYNYNFNTGTWYYIAVVYNTGNGTVTPYVNGVSLGASSVTIGSSLYQQYYIGRDQPNAVYFNGSIANVQIYNTTTDASSILAIYRGGIGAAPIDTAHLSAWWPLNGNANDYSGNNWNGDVVGPVVWKANWQSGYTAPSS
ncbi:MAG: LamG domain-containing protein [Candidatus Micrarchaeota archaeon]|nr:LamG domain-containing protein [Candidatus Micrarchaeota archaeon]